MSTLTCERCQKRPGEAHVFFYGKKTGSTTDQIDTNRQRITTSYDVSGKGGKVLCRACIRGYRVKTLLTQFFLGTAAAAYAVLVYSTTPFGVLTNFQCFLVSSAFLSVLGSLFYFGSFVGSIKAGQTTWGENLAISMEKKGLQTKGFDAFWNHDEYLKLQQKI